MSTDNNFAEWAIFLAAVCGQTYVQYDQADGTFVVPGDYQVRHIIYAESFNLVRERFGFILESPRAVVIAFRGTRSTADWLSDALAIQQNFRYAKENCLTHQGFTAIYSSARKGILSALAKLPEHKPLYITGHSLGGALATLCAVDVAENSAFAKPHVFTYGSPRVGDPAFAKAFAAHTARSYRIANPMDIVTMTPPSIFQLPKQPKKYYYSHVRTLYRLPFPGGVRNSHMLSRYYAALAALDMEFANWLNAANPGFCPTVKG
jgi:pimeloyl-ACP methyl ester carboxylesterase